MASRFLQLLTLLILSSCSPSAEERLAQKFSATLPSNVQVVNFAGSGAGMDHWYIWELAPVDDAFLSELVGSARLARWSPEDAPAGGLLSTWPVWWRQSQIEALPEVYSRSDANQYWRIWVDREQDRTYLQWFDT